MTPIDNVIDDDGTIMSATPTCSSHLPHHLSTWKTTGRDKTQLQQAIPAPPSRHAFFTARKVLFRGDSGNESKLGKKDE